MSGIVNTTGARSGIIGTTVGTPAGGPNIDEDGWVYGLNANLDQDSAATIVFQTEVQKGSNVTMSSGVVTPSKAGWYFLSCVFAQSGTTDDSRQLWFYKNSTKQHPRLYTTSPGELGYLATSMCTHVELNGTDTIQVYGYGHFYGEGDATYFDQMCSFAGYRLGA